MAGKAAYDIAIVGGCGRAGLPLALAFAHEGKRVAVVDIDERAVAAVRSGKMPFREDKGPEFLSRALSRRLLEASENPELVAQSETVIFILGTPVSSHLYPTNSQFFRAVCHYLPHLKNGQLVVFRSTLFPGTTEKIKNLFDRERLKADICFCPERIAEGRALTELYELPHIISGFSPRGLRRARRLFSVFNREIVELEPKEAELAKLFTNVWRYIQLSIANQFFITAATRGMDFYKIYKAITHKYPRLAALPGAGFTAGPCLFKDTMQLAAYTDNTLFLGHAAMLINEGLPTYLIGQLKEKYPLEKMTAGILGMAFKAESDDPRESLSYKLRNVLERECRSVLISDPYVKDERIVPADELVRRSQLIFVGAPHKNYRKLKLRGKIVVDVWNFFQKGCPL